MGAETTARRPAHPLSTLLSHDNLRGFLRLTFPLADVSARHESESELLRRFAARANVGERNERQRVERTPTRPAAAGRGAASVLLAAGSREPVKL